MALGWQIYDLTGSPFKLGLVGLMEFLPAFCLALVTGHIADRFDRRRIIVVGLTAELVAAVTLVGMILLDQVSVAGILGVAFAFGVVRAVSTPAQRAMMPNLVPKDRIPQRRRLVSSFAWQVATIGGPALGGLLYVLGPSVVYSATALALLASAVAISGISAAAAQSHDGAAESRLPAGRHHAHLPP